MDDPPPIEADRVRAQQAESDQMVSEAREAWRTTSAELTRLLRLNPTAVVMPLEPPYLQVTLLAPHEPVDSLVPIGLTNRPELASILQSLEGALPGDQWQAMQQTWTPAMLGQVAAMFGVPRERVDKVAATWEEGRTLVCMERKHGQHQVALSVVRHENAAGARAAFGLVVDLERQQDVLPPATCGLAIHVVDSKSMALHLDGFEEAVQSDKLIQYGQQGDAGGQPLPVSLLLARAGLPVTVLEKHKDFFRDFRGDTIHPSTLELMYELGLQG